MGQLNVLNQNISSQNKLISTFNNEISLLDDQIEEDNQVIAALNNDLENLKKEYGELIYTLNKTDYGFSKLSYLFASKNLSQFYMRYKYMEQYSAERKNQVKLIEEVKVEIAAEMNMLENTKNEKRALLSSQLKEKDKLSNLLAHQAKVLESLKKEEQQLLKDLKKKQSEADKLERIISQLLAEEIKKSSAGTGSKSTNSSANLANVAAGFEKSKANLPWPVTTGFISEKFGTHPHPVLKRVKIPNDGVNIQTKQNEQVKAVFDGIVKKIAIVPGDFKYVVIVQHGTYYTVYAKLKSVNVKMGQQVRKEDVIGEVNTDLEGLSEVQFQVWKNTEKLDPELWLAKR
ncbi:MAG: peptidoglycan DD-metalloendopeptidase family protein [Cyclobacteriaceae bacterium]|nr:peptidoglycan DD-metalloendopeptidase family protein [Cyclobacteriaceae bacterium]